MLHTFYYVLIEIISYACLTHGLPSTDCIMLISSIAVSAIIVSIIEFFIRLKEVRKFHKEGYNHKLIDLIASTRFYIESTIMRELIKLLEKNEDGSFTISKDDAKHIMNSVDVDYIDLPEKVQEELRKNAFELTQAIIENYKI